MSEEPINAEPVFDITDDDKLWAAISYATAFIPLSFPIGSLLVFLIEDKKTRPFVKTHAIQAVALWVVTFLVGLTVVGLCLAPISLVASFYWAYQAYQGENVEIPVITDFIKNQGWI